MGLAPGFVFTTLHFLCLLGTNALDYEAIRNDIQCEEQNLENLIIAS
jgi:hypothetical protein